VRAEVFMAVRMMMMLFWVLTPSSDLKMETVCFSDMLAHLPMSLHGSKIQKNITNVIVLQGIYPVQWSLQNEVIRQ
jgi:hypothetical protein